MSIVTALAEIQNALKSPKDQKADGYRYRNIEDINQAVKPLALAHGCAVIYTDAFSDGVCMSCCSLVSDEGTLSANGFAAVNSSPRGMSIEQACGAASSYARKYAACGLFAIDSSENDPDRVNAQSKQNKASKGATKAQTGNDEALKDAKVTLWNAEKAFCEKMGIQDVKAWHEQNIATRVDYALEVDALLQIADELMYCVKGE